MEVDGTFNSETVNLSANAGHLIVDDEGRIDADDIEDVRWVGFGGTGEGFGDQLRVVGTAGVDRITVSGSGANITVAGLAPTVTPVDLDSQDTLRIDTLDGADIVDSHDLQRGLVQLQVF
jgi:hypothetical protein